MKKYIATINESFVRDAQVCVGKNDSWVDLFPTVLLGIFEAESEIDAIQLASEITDYSKDIIEVVSIGNMKTYHKEEIPQGQTNIYDYLK